MTCFIIGGVVYNKTSKHTPPPETQIIAETPISAPNVIEQKPEIEKPKIEISNKNGYFITGQSH